MRRPLRRPRKVVMPPAVPESKTSWALNGPAKRLIGPTEKLMSGVNLLPETQRRFTELPPKRGTPRYMILKLTQISKKQYDDASKSPHLKGRRDNGFAVHNPQTDRLTAYVTEDGKYYESLMDPDYTLTMFANRYTKGVEVVTRMVFTEDKS